MENKVELEMDRQTDELSVYKRGYETERRWRCSLELELRTQCDLLRVTTNKLNAAHATITENKSTIRYLERQLEDVATSKGINSDRPDGGSVVAVIPRSVTETNTRQPKQLTPKIMELFLSQRKTQKLLINKLKAQQTELINIRNMLRLHAGKRKLEQQQPNIEYNKSDTNNTKRLSTTKRPTTDGISNNIPDYSAYEDADGSSQRLSADLLSSSEYLTPHCYANMCGSVEINSHEKRQAIRHSKSCPACGQQYSNHTDQTMFESHVVQCVDRLTVTNHHNTEAAGGADFAEAARAADFKSCPVCDLRFSAQTDQVTFETHVVSHFETEELGYAEINHQHLTSYAPSS